MIIVTGVAMGTTQVKYVSAGLFFLFIFLSGFWVSRSGKPYNVLIFTIHKLIGLGTGVFLVMTVYRIHQAAALNPLEITAIVITVLLFVFTVAAGGLLSVEAEGGLKNFPPSARQTFARVHKLSPYLIVLSTAVTLYLLLIA
jgi:hypothetical protein